MLNWRQAPRSGRQFPEMFSSEASRSVRQSSQVRMRMQASQESTHVAQGEAGDRTEVRQKSYDPGYQPAKHFNFNPYRIAALEEITPLRSDARRGASQQDVAGLKSH